MTAKTDRELLELAAKAAGIAKPVEPHGGYVRANGAFVYYDDCEGKRAHEWNPLTDDGDAFRLAVKLYLFNGADFYHFRSIERFARQDMDDCAATRRAIVRAAAAIGETP